MQSPVALVADECAVPGLQLHTDWITAAQEEVREAALVHVVLMQRMQGSPVGLCKALALLLAHANTVPETRSGYRSCWRPSMAAPGVR